MHRARVALALLVVLALGAGACGDGGGGKPATYPLDDRLRVDEVQLLTTHNSYHLRAPDPVSGAIGETLDYEHPPLDEQLEDQGVRGFELDVVKECLLVVKGWSDDHPGHAPIFILIEPKDGVLELGLDPTLQVFDAASFARFDQAVRSVLTPDDLLTPDDVRGKSDTLRDAVRERGWPTMGEARGKIVLILNNGSAARDAYLAGRDSLEGAPMFVTAEPDAPSAAVIKVDDPDEARIQRLVREHFVVRTRADADTLEARANDTARRDLALRSGAQMVSTDYPVPDPVINPEYSVQLPAGKPGRCNPVQAPKECRSVDVENAEHLKKV